MMRDGRSTTRGLAVSGLAILLLPGAAWAQRPESPGGRATVGLTNGSRVRLRAPGVVKGRLSGTVLEITEAALVLDSGDRRPVPVPRDAITQLEVSAGRRSRAGKGALVGAAAGAVLTPLSFVGLCGGGFSGGGSGECSAGDYATVAAAGALGGAMWGALIGHIKKGDDWRPIGIDALRVTVTPARGRGIAVAVTLGF